MCGDFNETMNNGKKIGGPRRADISFNALKEMLESCDMEELLSCGNMFTGGT